MTTFRWMKNSTRARRRVFVAALALLGCAPVAGARAGGASAAVCDFDLTGHAGNSGISPVGVAAPVPTPLDPLLGQPIRNHYTLSGPVRCTGSFEGEAIGRDDSNAAEGTMTADGWDPRSPVGSSPSDGYNACLVVTAPLDVTIHLKGHRRWAGQITMQTAMFDMALSGTIESTQLIGRAGFGADPDGSQGECTKTSPYSDWSVVGQVALTSLDLQPGGSTSPLAPLPKPQTPAPPPVGLQPVTHHVPIVQFQYVGGGTLDGPDGADPNPALSVGGLTVTQGDTITFSNLDTHPHTVTSCSAADCDPNGPALKAPGVGVVAGSAPSTCLQPGCADGTFDSEHSLDSTGGLFTLDTGRLAPGRYFYFCELHRWMRGDFTVAPHPSTGPGA